MPLAARSIPRSSAPRLAADSAPDLFPSDVSIHGDRGMVGNARDLTATEAVEGEGAEPRESRLLRGGAWYLLRLNSCCA
jgi:hypothetical protein